MTDTAKSLDEQILDQLKEMNENLSYIRAVAQRMNDRENNKLRAMRESMVQMPSVPR